MAKWQAARADVNQPDIVKYIRAHGATWQHTHTVPGALDGIIGFHGIDQRVEIKNPEVSKSMQKLTDAENKTFETWKGRKPIVILTYQDCKKVLKQLMKEGLLKTC